MNQQYIYATLRVPLPDDVVAMAQHMSRIGTAWGQVREALQGLEAVESCSIERAAQPRPARRRGRPPKVHAVPTEAA